MGAFGGLGHTPASLPAPYDIALGPEGEIYLCDREYAPGGAFNDHDGVKVFAADGQPLREIGAQDYGEGEPNNGPYGLDADSKGTVYVADYHRGRIRQFNPRGSPIRTVGRPASMVSPAKKRHLQALPRMFQRAIREEDVRLVLRTGEIIEEYPDDKPHPGRLVLGWVGPRPLHVVVAEPEDGNDHRIRARPATLGVGLQAETIVNCAICKQGTTENQPITVTPEREGATIVFHNVPAGVCRNCGEAYVNEITTKRMLEIAEEALVPV